MTTLAIASPYDAETAMTRFFLPGPTAVHPDVLRAMDAPQVSHRGAQLQVVVKDIVAGLQPVFGTARPLAIGTSSGPGLMEAGVLNGVRSKMLALVNGAFSERFAQIAEANGVPVERLVVEWGDVHDPNQVAEAVRSTGADAVSFVHNETSTGAVQDIPALTAAIRSASDDVVILTDSISGAGGAELQVDEWGIDWLATAGHKAIALPPGLGFGVPSEAMMERSATATRKGFYFDLARYMKSIESFSIPTTPAIPQLFAAQTQVARIAEEGMPQRLARHTAMAETTWAWAERHGLPIFAKAGYRSPTVSCVGLPEGHTGPELMAAMAERGWTIATGYGKLKPSTFRVGHMGEHTVAQVEEVLAEVKSVLGL